MTVEPGPASAGCLFFISVRLAIHGRAFPLNPGERAAGPTMTSRVGRGEGGSGFWQGAPKATGIADSQGWSVTNVVLGAAGSGEGARSVTLKTHTASARIPWAGLGGRR